MFRQVYEAGVALFLLQGVAIPVLLLLAGILWFRQMARLSALEKALAGDRARQHRTIAALLEAVPKLQPLSCARCGSPVALDPASAACTSCRSPAELPEDYRATLVLRRRLKRLAAAAIRHWRVAWVLTSAPVRWFFRLMIFAEPLLFMLVAIGAATFTDTRADRLFERIGEGWSFALMLMAFGGFILWMIVFLFLASLAKELRHALAALPELRRPEAGDPEFVTCRSCGGGVDFGRGAFAALCGYCAVPNFRAALARQEHARSAQAQRQARESLFGAMEVIEGYVGTFFVTMAILALGFALLVLFSAIGGS